MIGDGRHLAPTTLRRCAVGRRPGRYGEGVTAPAEPIPAVPIWVFLVIASSLGLIAAIGYVS